MRAVWTPKGQRDDEVGHLIPSVRRGDGECTEIRTAAKSFDDYVDTKYEDCRSLAPIKHERTQKKTSSLHHISLSIKVRPLPLKQVCTELTQSVVRLRDGSKSNLVFKKQISHLEQCRHTVQIQKAYCAHHIPCGQEDDLRLRNSPRCARFLKYSFPDKPHFIRECERCIVKKNNDPCD